MHIAAMTSVIYSQRNTKRKVRAIDAVRRLHDAGFSHVDLNLCGLSRNENEFCGEDWEARTDELKNEAERLGVRFVQSHAPYLPGNVSSSSPPDGRFEDMLLRSAEIIHMMGIPFAVVHPLQDALAPPEDRDAHLRLTLKAHGRFLDRLGKYGVRPAFENLPDTEKRGRFCACSDDLLTLLDFFGEYRPGVCWDFGHGNLALADQCGEIARLKDRILCVHTHDNKGRHDDHLMPFMGTIPWEKVLPALREAGFSNDLVLEVAQNANMPDELKDESVRLMAHASRILIRMFEDGA